MWGKFGFVDLGRAMHLPENCIERLRSRSIITKRLVLYSLTRHFPLVKMLNEVSKEKKKKTVLKASFADIQCWSAFSVTWNFADPLLDATNIEAGQNFMVCDEINVSPRCWLPSRWTVLKWNITVTRVFETVLVSFCVSSHFVLEEYI